MRPSATVLVALLALALVVHGARKSGKRAAMDGVNVMCASKFPATVTDMTPNCPGDAVYDRENAFCMSPCPAGSSPYPTDITKCVSDCNTKLQVANNLVCDPLNKCTGTTNKLDAASNKCCAACKAGFVASGTVCLSNCPAGYSVLASNILRCKKNGSPTTISRSQQKRNCVDPAAGTPRTLTDRTLYDPECETATFIAGKCIQDCPVYAFEPILGRDGWFWCNAAEECHEGYVQCGGFCLLKEEYDSKPADFCDGIDSLLTRIECISALTDYCDFGGDGDNSGGEYSPSKEYPEYSPSTEYPPAEYSPTEYSPSEFPPSEYSL